MTPILSTLVEGEWITGFIVAIITAVGGAFVAYRKGQASQQISLNPPIPTVPTQKVTTPPTWDQFLGHDRRIETLEHTVAEVRRDQAVQFRELLEAGATRESRLSEQIGSSMRTIHARIDEVLKNCATRQCHFPNPSKPR